VAQSSNKTFVAVRMEGGLGDHILGMRVLRFIHERHPQTNVSVFCDCAGHSDPLQIVRMSPLVSEVLPVYQSAPPQRLDTIGKLVNLRPQDLARMKAADVFIDAAGEQVFSAAPILDVPLFELLADRPKLAVPSEDHERTTRLLEPYGDAVFVGLNLAKYGAEVLSRYETRIMRVLDHMLLNPNVVVLNIFTSSYDYPHWPEPERTRRRERSRTDHDFLVRLAAQSDRVVSCVDLPLVTIAAILQRCAYFVGLDNGIKHLAWALGVPHSFFHPAPPDMLQAARWMPDLNRILLFDSKESTLVRHLDAMSAAIREAALRAVPRSSEHSPRRASPQM
jgi:hypothetical protein